MANRPDQPGDFPPQFYKYWGPGGAGGALIRWGTDGDFDRCVAAINSKIEEKHGKPLADHEIKGLCSNLHQTYTGARPGHAPAEEAERKAKDAAKKAAH